MMCFQMNKQSKFSMSSASVVFEVGSPKSSQGTLSAVIVTEFLRTFSALTPLIKSSLKPLIINTPSMRKTILKLSSLLQSRNFTVAVSSRSNSSRESSCLTIELRMRSRSTSSLRSNLVLQKRLCSSSQTRDMSQSDRRQVSSESSFDRHLISFIKGWELT